MQLKEHHLRYDSLSSEDLHFQIPLRKEKVLQWIGRAKTVLDVGCSGGKFSRLIQGRNNRVTGMDVNPCSVQASIEAGITAVQGDADEALPFEDESFDVVHAGELLEHLYDTKTFFQEAWRVLKPGGYFIFTSRNLNSLENRVRVLSGSYLNQVGAYPEDHNGRRIRIFNRDKIEELCEDTHFEGLEILGLTGPNPKGFQWHKRWVGKWLPGLSELLLVRAQKPVQSL